jgi:hypothetical protein
VVPINPGRLALGVWTAQPRAPNVFETASSAFLRAVIATVASGMSTVTASTDAPPTVRAS